MSRRSRSRKMASHTDRRQVVCSEGCELDHCTHNFAATDCASAAVRIAGSSGVGGHLLWLSCAVCRVATEPNSWLRAAR